MNYVKKMCILRQVKQGFAGDGKTLSGLIKIEQYGKNIAVEISAINFAPLVSGEYYCVLADTRGKTELLPLRGKSIFNILSDIHIEQGFCGVICYVKNEVIPVAYGVNGDGVYDWKKIVNATLPTVYTPFTEEKNVAIEYAEEENLPQADGYDDEKVCMENYYEKEENDEQELLCETGDDARFEGATEKQDEKEGLATAQDDDVDGVLHPFKTDGDGYYQSVKHEIDKLLAKYPRDTRLCGAFSCSEWVRIENDGSAEEYLVGVVYANGAAKYVCYALPAKEKDNPPKEIADVCVFVPQSPFRDTEGFFVIFQSAATGECIKPKKI
jgi:hypothetical protein